MNKQIEVIEKLKSMGYEVEKDEDDYVTMYSKDTEVLIIVCPKNETYEEIKNSMYYLDEMDMLEEKGLKVNEYLITYIMDENNGDNEETKLEAKSDTYAFRRIYSNNLNQVCQKIGNERLVSFEKMQDINDKGDFTVNPFSEVDACFLSEFIQFLNEFNEGDKEKIVFKYPAVMGESVFEIIAEAMGFRVK